MKSIKNNHIIFSLLISIFTFVILFKPDSDPFITSEYTFPPDQMEVELLLENKCDSPPVFGILNNPPVEIFTVDPTEISLSKNYKGALYIFNNRLDQRIKLLTSKFIPPGFLEQLLLKNIRLPQSSDDDLPLLS